MRFRLRTLLIVLAVAPVDLAHVLLSRAVLMGMRGSTGLPGIPW